MVTEMQIAGRVPESTPLHETAELTVRANTLLGAALTYGECGWPVFPCRANKRPLTEHGFHNATTNGPQIVRWWRQWPDALIGMPLKPNCVVVDVDDYAGLEELERRGLDLPDTLTARTPRGWHYWYWTSAPIGPRTAVIPHVDIRGLGSYVVVPPSPGYRWQVVGRISNGLV